MEKVRCILIVDGESSEKRTGVWYNNQVLKVGWGAGLGGEFLPRSSEPCCFATWSSNIILLWSLVPFKFLEPWSPACCSPEPLTPKTHANKDGAR